VDSQTRHALKQDKFVQTTQSGVSWVGEHRSSVIRYSLRWWLFWHCSLQDCYLLQSALRGCRDRAGCGSGYVRLAAGSAGSSRGKGRLYFGCGSVQGGQSAVCAGRQPVWVAAAGAKAHYFAGLTDQALGQNGSAESELKAAASSWDGNLSSLAKFALAGFYHQTGRDPQAIDLYNGLIAKPTTAVPVFTAQLALADLYASSGKTEQAKQIWAKVKDADKTGAAGSIASEKLTKK
jgi:tetratricopeptide (TPR) repeat protein